MAKYKFLKLWCIVAALVLIAAQMGLAGTKSSSAGARLGKTTGFEVRLSNISNNEFYLANYGVFGHNVATGLAGWYWPRQSNKAYIFGMSVWFGTKKKVGADTLKLVSVGYNPNSGASWFVPGSIDDGLSRLDDSDPNAAKYYLYMGTDFTPAGVNAKNKDKAVWPIRWKDQTRTPGKNGYFGEYISDPTERANYAPVFISQEDMFSIYKDTDVKANPEYKPGSGYPVGLDIQGTTYSWGFGPYKDFVFFVYNVINKSSDTLRSCYLAPAGDPDMGTATNDHNAYYLRDPSLNLAFQFTETEAGYAGILGFDFLESPKVKSVADSIEVFQKTGLTRNIGEQIGLTTFRNWTIDIDPANGPARYDFMASGTRDQDNGPGDKRLLTATGPFTMNPGDTARTVVCVMLAPGVGSWNAPPDVQNSGYLDSLVSLDKFAQKVYDNNFAAPKPPDPAQVTASGIDRGVMVTWDTTSEASKDTLSGGAAFYGYRVYRSRSQSGPWKLLMDSSMSTAAGAPASKYLPHAFIDVGSDTSTGLVNNVDYYYWVSSYDQGDPIQNIKPLENTPVPNLNSVRVEPVGPSAGNDAKFENFSSPNLGSIRNFRVEQTNQLRFNQLFAGHPLKVTMESANSGTAYTVAITVSDTVGNYKQALTFTPGLVVLPNPGDFPNDTTLTGVYRSAELFYCFKIAFDWSFVQRKTAMHFDTVIVSKGTAALPLIRRGTPTPDTPFPGFSPNINLGEANITVDFSTGGADSVDLTAGGYGMVLMPYLNVTVRNATTGEVLLVDNSATSGLTYEPYGSYFFLNYFWLKSGAAKTYAKVELNAGGKYYYAAPYIGTDSIVTAAYINVNGQQLGIDMYNTGGKGGFLRSWPAVTPGTKDISAGDQITISFKGGVAGTLGAAAFPSPGATITAKASLSTPPKYSAEILKQIKVVPNPYIISHDAQVTTDAPKLFFNHLPPVCTIRIYNVAGDLIKVLNHNGGAQEVWDLLSDGRQKVASQLLLAYVETPDGANQIIKFSVIVGGFRSIR